MRPFIDKRINAQIPQPDWPPVVVAGAYLTGVVLMRDLVRRGLEVCAVDFNPGQPGFKSVYGTTYLCPNPDDDPAGWLAFMVQLSRKLDAKPVLMSSADQFVSAIAQHAAELEEHYIFCASAMSVQALLATKRRQYAVAADNGLPVPRTQFVSSRQDIEDFSRVAQFPCLLKPVHFRDWQRVERGHPLYCEKLVLAADPAELLEKYRLAAEINPELVVQEIIEGPDTAKLVYLSCYARDGSRLAGCVVREMRTMPMDFGSATIVEPVDDPEADRASDSFLRGIGYVGICELELKRDTRDGVVRLIEANPRYSVTSDSAAYAGIELGWLHYLDLIGQKVTPVTRSPRGFRHIVLSRDFSCIGEYRRAGLLTWGQLLKSYRPPVAFFDFDLHDWRVTLDVLTGIAKGVLYPVYRFFVPKKQGSA
jgi:predicted ATP-grasp superfamily ATP-dependent carboligase